MEAIGRLAGGVAHDFNNLLTIINGYSEIILEGLSSDDPWQAELKEIKAAGVRAASLTRQLLTFSRKQVIEPTVLDLNIIVTNLEKMLRRLIGEDVELVTVLDENLGKVNADPGQVEQIIMNLAINARDAIVDVGQLTIETSNVYLDGTYAGTHLEAIPGQYVMLAVSDNGVGMTEEIKNKIFEPFFTTKEMGKGTGLGLATVFGIVKQSGGNIYVYSEPGQGTTFKIYLPQVEEDVSRIEARPDLSIPVARSETVLLVEDDDKVRAFASESLRGCGYKVLEASDGGEALLICEQYSGPIHILLTDVVMPRMSGRELAEKLEGLRPETKVLYMSGYTDDTIARHGVLDEGVNFVSKPFSQDTLAAKVRQVLDGVDRFSGSAGTADTMDSPG